MTASRLGELNPPPRILLGPGPSNVDPRVYRAMLAPVLGHLDPDFLQIMDDVQVLLRRLFQTSNRLSFPVSGTGSAGMETAMCNCLEPGDTAIITDAGYGEQFGHGLGHGLGLDVHEGPYFNQQSTDVRLDPGMVMTVEPGIYLPGVGGVRIEDDVLITESGARVLSNWPKDLDSVVVEPEEAASPMS